MLVARAARLLVATDEAFHRRILKIIQYPETSRFSKVFVRAVKYSVEHDPRLHEDQFQLLRRIGAGMWRFMVRAKEINVMRACAASALLDSTDASSGKLFLEKFAGYHSNVSGSLFKETLVTMNPEAAS